MDGSVLDNTHLKDFRLAIEFKYLMKHSPGGVYLMPQFDDIRKLNGVIFVRRGLYRNGIFRFQMTLSKNYNSINNHPEIKFTPQVFNPLIDESGKLDLRLDEACREWQPEKHFIVTALTFLKKIFYMKSFQQFAHVPNENARQLLESDKEEYLRRVEECVQESLRLVHETQPDSTLVFTEPKPAHDILRRQIYARGRTAESESAVAQDSDRGYYDRTNEAEDAAERDEGAGAVAGPSKGLSEE